jgi:hypothetical protein
MVQLVATYLAMSRMRMMMMIMVNRMKRVATSMNLMNLMKNLAFTTPGTFVHFRIEYKLMQCRGQRGIDMWEG